MSAPAMKALLPAPVRITPPTAASACASSNAVLRSAQVGEFRALSTLGRLTVTYAMAPFFSYRTFASVGAAAGDAAGMISGEPSGDAGGMFTFLLKRMSQENYCRIALDEGAETRDGLADDQILHLIRAFVRVKCFAIGEETRHLVVCDDAIAAEQLARPSNGLSAFRRRKSLGERCMGVGQLAFGVQLRLTQDQALRSRDVGDHFGEQILHQLERCDGPAKLQALLAVLECRFIGAHRASGRHPGDGVTRHLQHSGGVAERVAALKTIGFRNSHVLESDVTVLDNLEGGLVLD